MSYKGIDNLKISAHNHKARLAEWSKALVLSANDRNVARVRIPHLANYFYIIRRSTIVKTCQYNFGTVKVDQIAINKCFTNTLITLRYQF